jgi:hypothetical protein
LESDSGNGSSDNDIRVDEGGWDTESDNDDDGGMDAIFILVGQRVIAATAAQIVMLMLMTVFLKMRACPLMWHLHETLVSSSLSTV